MINTSDFDVAGRNLFPVIEEMLEDGKSVRFTVSGNSMWPLIINNRDSVLLVPRSNKRLKKGEIILFRTGISHYVLHRITKVKKGGYITTGDGNLHRDGFVAEAAVRAKVTVVYRKNRIIDCNKWYWKMVFHSWMAAFPVRYFLIKMIVKVRRCGKK